MMENSLEYASFVFQEEAKAILNLENLLTNDFNVAVELILQTKGKIIVTGVGKSGHIGKKIAASFASTGTPSFYVHPTEAFHGDLGMIEKDDTVLAITNSGETDEVLRLTSFFKNNHNKIISLTGNPTSTLAKHADVNLNIHVDKEVCPLNLAPTTSATTTLVMGHALVVALMHAREFKDESYAKLHPGGSLGKRLLTKVKDIMETDNLPLASEDTDLLEVISTISKSHFGLVVVTDKQEVKGVLTDGDLRRMIYKYPKDFHQKSASEVMTKSPITCDFAESIDNAKQLMERNKVNTLLIADRGLLKGLLTYKQVVNL